MIGRGLLPSPDALRSYDALCVLGPTACGKTAFAVALASAMGNGEILSADSRQVYRGMDIGTGKDLEEYGEIPYHLIDIVDAGTKYNLFEYQRDFSKSYCEVRSRGALPIICGGSGLYIEAVTREGYDLKAVPPDAKVREAMEARSFESLLEEYFTLKRKHGFEPHNHTDFDTKKRLIRALEIEMAVDKQADAEYADAGDLSELETVSDGTCNSKVCEMQGGNPVLPRRVYFIGLEVSPEVRRERIDRRLDARLKEGMVDEVQRLIDGGIPPEDLVYYGLEYKFVTQYLTGEFGYAEYNGGAYAYLREHLAIAIHQFAKRQMTWFRGMERRGVEIHWIAV